MKLHPLLFSRLLMVLQSISVDMTISLVSLHPMVLLFVVMTISVTVYQLMMKMIWALLQKKKAIVVLLMICTFFIQ